MPEIITDEYAISTSRLLALALQLRFMPLITVMCILTVAALAAGILVDIRWFIISFMLLLVVAPCVLALLYLLYALSPRCFQNVWPHRTSLTPDGITLTGEITPPVKENSDDDDDSAPPEARPIRLDVPWKDVRRLRIGLHGMTLVFRGKPAGFLDIPYSAIPDADTAIKYIRQHIEK